MHAIFVQWSQSFFKAAFGFLFPHNLTNFFNDKINEISREIVGLFYFSCDKFFLYWFIPTFPRKYSFASRVKCTFISPKPKFLRKRYFREKT